MVKMNILLLTPNVTAEDRYGKKLKKLGPMLFPSLSLGYLAAVLEKAGHKVKIIDSPIEGMTKEKLENYLSKNKFDAIGITLLTPMYKSFVETIRYIKSIVRDIPIIAGGPHPSIAPLKTLEENPELSYTVYGEGEITIVELMKAISGKIPISSVKGIAYRSKKGLKLNSPRPYIENLDDIPPPALHLMPIEKYIPAPSTYRKLPSLNIIATRGCPFRCIYCSSQSIFGRVYRNHSVDRIITEIENLIKTYKAKEIYFLDDLFTFNMKWVEELCGKIKKKKIQKKISWSCNTRVNLVNLPLLKKMKEAGCWQIHYGIESGSQRLLNLIKKGITLKQAEDAIMWTRKAGIQSRAYFMIGLPTETKEESRQTIEFAKKINPDYAKFSLTTPYPGTELFEIVRKSGELKSFSWDKYKTMGGFAGTERPYTPKGRTSKELNDLQKKAHKEFYIRFRTIINHLSHISSLSELIIDVKSFLKLLRV